MAAMIWDTEAQAYKEAETPMIHDPASGAWVETTGLAYNPEAEAWEEKWSAFKPYVLYDNGVFSDTYKLSNCYQSGGYLTINSTTFTLRSNSGQYRMVFDTPIDLSIYNKIKAICKITGGVNGDSISLGVHSDTSYNNPGNLHGYNRGDICQKEFLVNNAYEELELDISEINSEYRVGLCSVSNFSTLTSEYQKVWLE